MLSFPQEDYAQEIVVVDLETTGINPKKDEILEIAAVKVKGQEITESYTTLVRPSGKIPLKVKRLTGIDEIMVADAPLIQEVIEELKDFIGSGILVGHNVAFDAAFIQAATGTILPNPLWDTVELARIIYPSLKNYRLQTLNQIFSLHQGRNHRALADATITARLIIQLQQKALTIDSQTLAIINSLLANTNWSGRGFFRISPDNPLHWSTPAGGKDSIMVPLESEITRGEDLFASPGKASTPDFSMGEIKSLLSPEGPLAAVFSPYEERLQQVTMLEEVCQALEEEKFLVMEAGTGTGKSLAYLIPALYWARSRGEKVVVATHTINLQEQLISKDVPALSKILPFSFKAAVVKGRGNYLCLRRWQGKLKEAGRLEEEEAKFCSRIMMWLKETTTGDRSELNLTGPGSDFWQALWADRESCIGARCPWSGKCYLRLARKRADEADLLVVNHSLVFSDISANNKVLPEYKYLIIDEAHHLEEEATQHLGTELSYLSIRRYLRTLFQGFGEKLNPGILGSLRQTLARISGERFKNSKHEDLPKFVEDCIEKVFIVGEGATEFFDLLAGFARSAGLGTEELQVITQRLRAEHHKAEMWSRVKIAGENMTLRLGNLIDGLGRLVQRLEQEDTGWDLEFTALVAEVKSLISSGEEIIGIINFLLGPMQEDYVYWLESGEFNTFIKAAPIKIGPLVAKHIFEQKKSVILTSATLSVDNSFEHFIERTGLKLAQEERLRVKGVESPFSYESQSLLCLVKDMPNPGQIPDELYMEAVTPFIKGLVEIMGGRTLVLFTSHKMLKDAYSRLKPDLENLNICLLGHGIDGSRNRLVEEFKETPGSVLFGASSFWEGVDLPGDGLSCVVIVKLPFWPPNIPTVEARLEDLQKNGINSFRHFTLPKAVLRLKQGFGRLIRTAQDEGIVIVLDPRVIQKNYGKKFLSSLPVKSHYRGSSPEVLKKIGSWLAGERISTETLNVINDPDVIKEFLSKMKKKG